MIGSCGHQCASTFSVRYRSETCDAIEGFLPCVIYAEYCPACAAEAATWPEFIGSDAEEEAALQRITEPTDAPLEGVISGPAKAASNLPNPNHSRNTGRG